MKNNELKAHLIDSTIRLEDFMDGYKGLKDEDGEVIELMDEVFYIALDQLAYTIKSNLGIRESRYLLQEFCLKEFRSPLLEDSEPQDAKAFVNFLFDYAEMQDGIHTENLL